MSGTLGRDKVWNEHIWSEIDKAVRDEVGRIRVAQKVFPSNIVNNMQAVSVSALPDHKTLKTDDEFRPFVEMSKPFMLTPAQVDSEEQMHIGRTLARLAAKTIAAGEDRFLFLGKQADLENWGGINVTNKNALPDGFYAVAEKSGQVEVGHDILGALAHAIAKLNERNQPGPYALFLSPEQYADTFKPISNNPLVTTSDRIIPLVASGFYPVNSLAYQIASPIKPEIGILVSLGGQPATIYIAAEATTASTYTDDNGNYHFRVFERIQLVVHDRAAFEALKFPVLSPP